MKPLKIFFIGLFSSLAGNLMAQNISVHSEQELSFGTFYFSEGTGGTIKISDRGEWSSSGNAHLVIQNHHPAVFIISTDSPEPIDVQVETFAQAMQSPAKQNLYLSLDKLPSIYTIQAGSPVQIILGGLLQIDPNTTTISGSYNGDVSLRVTLFNE